MAGEPVLVTDLVIAEVFHALRHHYRVPAAEVNDLDEAPAKETIALIEQVGAR